jgi:sortase A
MDPHKNSTNDPFGASLPLPQEPAKPDSSELAADLIRKKVQEAYSQEPDAIEETLDVAQTTVKPQSKHQKFVAELTSSGKSLQEIQTAWHEYYAGLGDVEQHEVWEEFEQMHAQAARFPGANNAMAPPQEKVLEPEPFIIKDPEPSRSAFSKTIADLRQYTTAGVTTRSKLKPKQHVQSLLFGLGIGSIVILILLFSFFNERFIAPFIQPSRTLTNTEIINDTSTVSAAPEVIIPKINVEIPVVYGINTISEAAIDNGLEQGVVHYTNTAEPGQNGNTVVVGHSSNNIFNKGKYKFAFVLLSRMENGDTFYLQKDGKRYTYQVYEKKIVKPTDVSVLGPTEKQATATLITCDPPGTSTNRLVVVGQQISPDPAGNSGAQVAQSNVTEKSTIIPGNSPSLWSRLTKWISS